MSTSEFILAFTSHNPFVSLCIVASAYYGWKYPWSVLKRAIRSRDIQKHGWPSAPMDADGDIITQMDDKA